MLTTLLSKQYGVCVCVCLFFFLGGGRNHPHRGEGVVIIRIGGGSNPYVVGRQGGEVVGWGETPPL